MKRLAELVGRRGAAVLLLATLQITIGYSWFKVPATATQGLLILNLLPPDAWGCVWLAFGALSLPFAFRSAGKDRVGFMLLYVVPFVQGMAYAVSTLLGAYPPALGFRAAVIWWGYSGLVLIISGMVSAKGLLNDARRDHPSRYR